MTAKHYFVAMSILVVAGLVSSIYFAATPAVGAQGTGGAGDRRWEYCVLGELRGGPYSKGANGTIVYFGEAAEKRETVEAATQEIVLAKAFAKLGIEGWEFVSQGNKQETPDLWTRMFFFKRPKR